MSYDKHWVLFSPGFPAHEEDWYCIPPLQGLAESLSRLEPRARITVVALHYPYEPREYTWKGIQVIALGGNNVRFPKKLSLWGRALQALKKLHREQPIDVLHTFWLQECTFLGRRFAKPRKIRQIATIMGQDATAANQYKQRKNQRHAHIVAISKAASKAYQEQFDFLVTTVIPWGADGQIVELARRKDRLEKEYDIVGVGNLVPVKNYALFLDVIAELKQKRPEVSALLIGGGPEENMLKAQAEALGIDENIHFAGHLDRPEILEYLRKSRVFLHTAAYEGQGYVFLEAQAAGLPIVSTPVGMAARTERWVTLDTAQKLAMGCLQFLELDIDFPAIAPFTIEDSARAYLEIYQA